jgi:D-3-phosphoglycerate dehydrogenase / 2-oxoglutarate reductase
MQKVIVLDDIAQEGLDLLDAAEGITYEVRTGLKGAELRAALTEFDGAICRSGVKITGDALAGNRRLRAIARAGVGTDNIDKAMATRQGIVVMNTPGGNTLSTAEHAFALMLALSRKVAAAHQSLVEGRWDRKSYMGSQLADKTLGIVGPGTNRQRGRAPSPGLRHARDRLRSVPDGRSRRETGDRAGRDGPRDAAEGSTT